MDFEKILELFKARHEESVDYILVGAVGMTVHGIVRATQDVDLFVLPETENVARLRTAMRRVFPDDPSIEDISASDLGGDYSTIRYNSIDGSMTIDILSRLGEMFSYEGLQYEEKQYEGIPVRVATPKQLYEMKKDTLRLQDRADAESLKELFKLGEQ